MALQVLDRHPAQSGYVTWYVGNVGDQPSSGFAAGSYFFAQDQAILYVSPDGATWSALPSVAVSQVALIDAWPWGGTPVTFSPVTHGNSVAYVFPFTLWSPMVINQVAIKTAAVVAGCLQLGIFDATGNQKWTSGALSTLLAAWVKTTVNLPVTLQAGQYYFATTNNGSAAGTAAYYGVPTSGSADMPRWGTVACSGGAMPGSIAPGSITKADLNFMCYALLETWT